MRHGTVDAVDGVLGCECEGVPVDPTSTPSSIGAGFSEESHCTDARGVNGHRLCGVLNVLLHEPTRYSVMCARGVCGVVWWGPIHLHGRGRHVQWCLVQWHSGPFWRFALMCRPLCPTGPGVGVSCALRAVVSHAVLVRPVSVSC